MSPSGSSLRKPIGPAPPVCQPHLGASLRKGWFRMIGTVVGAVAIVVLTACFPQERAAFLVGLALWGAACALVATVLRNFAAYAAALAGYTAAIIANDELGATGGPNGDAFMLAIFRVSEIWIGIVCAGIVLAGTDLGGARRRLAAAFAAVSAEIVDRFGATLAPAGSMSSDTQQPVRRELIRKVVALDPVVDEAIGESSTLRYHSPVLQEALEGLMVAIIGWRSVGVRLTRLPDRVAREEADALLRNIPQQLRSVPGPGEPSPWMVDPLGMRRLCSEGARKLIAMPVGTPSLRLFADQSARVLVGLIHALDALALLTGKPDRPGARRRVRLHVADWWPAFVNAGRTFVAIGAMELFWIVTAWPNGAFAIAFTAITVILLAPLADAAYAFAYRFALGCVLGSIGAAIIEFAVLPKVETFIGFSIVLGLYLIPAGALVAQPWQTPVFIAMTYSIRPTARSRQPDDLRHRAILQYRAGDRWRDGRRHAVISTFAAALARLSDAPSACADVARSEAPRGESPMAARGLGRPHAQPYRGITRRSDAVAAGADRDRAVGWERDHQSSADCLSTRLRPGARGGARGLGGRR
jgi:Fusaric acid resistance protein family